MILSILLIHAGLVLAGQVAPPAMPQAAFSAASIRPNKTLANNDGVVQSFPGGRLVATNISLRSLILAAYNITPGELTIPEGQQWIVSDRYDVQATSEPNSMAGTISPKEINDKVMLMFQRLLADRFKLAVRHEIRTQPVYELVVSKKGSKLVSAKIDESQCANSPNGGGRTACHQLSAGPARGIHGDAVDMSDLVKALQVRGRIVVDRTELKGLYAIHTGPFHPEQPGTSNEIPSDSPSVFNLLEDELGLRLEVFKNSADILIVEHAEKPAAN